MGMTCTPGSAPHNNDVGLVFISSELGGRKINNFLHIVFGGDLAILGEDLEVLAPLYDHDA